MLKYITGILSVFILSSCGTGLRIGRKDYAPINNRFNATICNNPFKTKGRTYSELTLLDMFDLFRLHSDSISLHFDEKEKLVLIFNDSLLKRTEIFEGRFKKKGYYEIYLRYKKKEIPPFVPIIYGYRDIDRIRIGLTKENNLVVDNKWARDGNIFILAGGGSGRFRCFFKPITEKKLSSNSIDSICIPNIDTLDGHPVYIVTDKKAEFPNGQDSLMNYLGRSIEYPQEEEYQGSIYITFIIDYTGKIRNTCIYKQLRSGYLTKIEQECIRVIEEMPNWNPAEMNGQKVYSREIIPIKLGLQEIK